MNILRQFMKVFSADGLHSTKKTRVNNEAIVVWKSLRVKSEDENLESVLC
jgi:hypothetical protein